MGYEAATGADGYGFAYQGSGAQLATTGAQPHQYGVTFKAGDTLGVLLDADAASLTFFVNQECQGVAFEGMRRTMRATHEHSALLPALGLHKSGVRLGIRHCLRPPHTFPLSSVPIE